MARMLAHEHFIGYCCADCRRNLTTKIVRRLQRRREKRQWRKEYAI